MSSFSKELQAIGMQLCPLHKKLFYIIPDMQKYVSRIKNIYKYRPSYISDIISLNYVDDYCNNLYIKIFEIALLINVKKSIEKNDSNIVLSDLPIGYMQIIVYKEYEYKKKVLNFYEMNISPSEILKMIANDLSDSPMWDSIVMYINDKNITQSILGSNIYISIDNFHLLLPDIIPNTYIKLQVMLGEVNRSSHYNRLLNYIFSGMETCLDDEFVNEYERLLWESRGL